MNSSNHKYDVVVIGGGFFGCSLAINYRRKNKRVLVIEMGKDLLGRASYTNQARVHNGYHYPRSMLTAIRSRINFPRFVRDYSECIFSEFEQYYAVGRNFSKVTANQYRLFMERIGADISPAPKNIKQLANPDLIEEIFSVKEFAFDSVKLKQIVKKKLSDVGVEVRYNTKVIGLNHIENQGIHVHCETIENDRTDNYSILAHRVFNCTYSHLNQILRDSQITLLPLKHEITEMALIQVPDELNDLGITVMCGPFFSFMPFPPAQCHSLSHVRYTPHQFWVDTPETYHDTYEALELSETRSHALHMIKDAQRYFPILKHARYMDSLWEVKTILPTSEIDDSRPIMLMNNYGMPGLTCVLGGKIDNIYDVLEELSGEP